MSLHEVPGHDVLKSDEGVRVVRFKRGLVIELFLRHGEFWRRVETHRTYWEIQANAQLVPAWVFCPWPEDPDTWDKAQRNRWKRQIHDLVNRVLPERFLKASVDWFRFFSACVLYDPPADALLDFARFAGPYPEAPLPVSKEDGDAMGDDWTLLMAAPLVKHAGGAWHIEVTKDATENDVINAWRLIKQTMPDRQAGGRPPMDDLTALQCAVLYDDHNGTDPEDRRIRLWTYKKLANKFGLKNERSAEEHVKRGRALRKLS